ncbi:uncharacterized protein LOC144452346 isoform X2 [Glandiceps talaboti]
MTLIEQCECKCGATSEPLPFTQMVHYVSATALCAQAKQMREEHNIYEPVMFSILLQRAGGVGDVRNCPSNCGKSIQLQRKLMNCPEIVSIGLVWDSDQPSIDHIMDVIRSLGTTIRLPYVFQGVFDDRAHKSILYLVGIVTYYGKHYSTFFFHTKLRVWIYFDDATVREIGKSWSDVVEKCRRGHYQPLLLLYADPSGTVVSTETAPTKVFMLPNDTQPDRSHWRGDSCSYNQHFGSDGSERHTSSYWQNRSNIGKNHETSTETQSLSSLTSTEETAQQPAKRRSRGRSKSRDRARENYDTVSVSSSASNSSADKSKTRKSRSKSLDKLRSLRRQFSNASYSSTDSQRIDDYEDLNTLERKRPFQGVPIPPDNRYHTPGNGKLSTASPKMPKALKSPKVKRKGSFKGGKDIVRADIIRCEISANAGTTKQDSLVYNPYDNLPTLDQDEPLQQSQATEFKSCERSEVNKGGQKLQSGNVDNHQNNGTSSYVEDLKQIHTSPEHQLGFPQSVEPNSNYEQLQLIHEQWLNEQKLLRGEQLSKTVGQLQGNKTPAVCTPTSQAENPSNVPVLQQNPPKQEQQIYYYQPKPQQHRYPTTPVVHKDSSSEVYTSNQSVIHPEHQHFPLANHNLQKKRMTPKLVKQRNTENKPASKNGSSSEIKLAKRLRRKSLGGFDNRGTEELKEAIAQQQQPLRPSSALPFKDHMMEHLETDKGYTSVDHIKGGLVHSGYATLPRKVKTKSGSAVSSSALMTKQSSVQVNNSNVIPSGNGQTVTGSGQTVTGSGQTVTGSGGLQRSASFHCRSQNSIYKTDDSNTVIPTELGPMVRANKQMNCEADKGRNRSSNSSADSCHSETSSRHSVQSEKYGRQSNTATPLMKHKGVLQGDTPYIAEIGRRDSGYKSGDRTSGSSTSSFSADIPIVEHSHSYMPLRNLRHGPHIDKNHQGQMSSDNGQNLIDFSRAEQVKLSKVDSIRCDSLLQEAENLMDKSSQAEKKGDLATSLCSCLNAITRLRSAMDLTEIDHNHRGRVILETRHKACLLKSQSLHRRLVAKRQDPMMNSLYKDDSINDQLSTMVSNLSIPGKRSDDLINLQDPESKKQQDLQQQIRKLYQQRNGNLVPQYPSQDQPVCTSQPQSVTRYLQQNDRMINERASNALGSQPDLSRAQPVSERELNTNYRNVETVYRTKSDNYGQLGCGNKLQKSHENLRYGRQNSTQGNPSTETSNLDNKNHYGNYYSVLQDDSRRDEQNHREFMRQREQEVKMLETPKDRTYHKYKETSNRCENDNIGSHQQYSAVGITYGDLTRSKPISKSTPNVNVIETYQRTAYRKPRTEQDKQHDVDRQKQIILARHREMVAKQKQTLLEKQELLDRQNHNPKQQLNNEYTRSQPMLYYPQSDVQRHTSQDPKQVALQTWYRKEKDRHNPTQRRETGNQDTATLSGTCPKCGCKEYWLPDAAKCYMCDFHTNTQTIPIGIASTRT